MRPFTSTARASITTQGPCLMCGGLYARHRVIDTQMEMVSAGDSIEAVAAEYGTTVTEMVTGWCALIDLYEDAITASLEVAP